MAEEQKLTVVEVQGVHGYLDDEGTAWLNAADVARGLGFVHVEEKVSPTNGRKTYTSIRWETINRYLKGFSFRQNVGENDFIPENMFYRLAMKASNATAEKFQALVADEILPALRKHGYYSVKNDARELMEPMTENVELSFQRIHIIQNDHEIERQNFEIEKNRLKLEKQRLEIEHNDLKLAYSRLLRKNYALQKKQKDAEKFDSLRDRYSKK